MCSVAREVTRVLSRLPRYSKRRSRVLRLSGRMSVSLPPSRERRPVLTSLRLPFLSTWMTSMRARTIECPAQLTIRPRTTWRLPRREVSERLWFAVKYIVSLPQVLPRTPLASRLWLPALLAEPLAPLPLLAPLEPGPVGVWPVGSQTLPLKATFATPAMTSSTGVPAAESTFRCIALMASELPVRTCSSNFRSTTSPRGASCCASCCAACSIGTSWPPMVRPVVSLEPSRTGEPATHVAETWALAARTPSVVVPAPGGSWTARFSTRPMAPTAWRAAISFSGLATVVAEDVRAETASAGMPSGDGRLSSPVALDTHGLAAATTGLAPGFPASELDAALALHCQEGWACAALASAAEARTATRPAPDHVMGRI